MYQRRRNSQTNSQQQERANPFSFRAASTFSSSDAAKEAGELVIVVWSQGNTDLIGHVSLTVTNPDGSPNPVLGLSPARLPEGTREEVGNLLLGTNGKIYKNDHILLKDRQMKVQTFPLNLEQRAKIETEINKARRNPPTYSIFNGHTCASWAVEVAEKAGIQVAGVYNYIANAPKLIERASQPPTDEFLEQMGELPSSESD